MTSSSTQENTILSEVTAAALGGAISSGVLYPLEVLKTKMQAQQKQQENNNHNTNNDNANDNKNESSASLSSLPKNSMLEYAQYIYHTEGGFHVFTHGLGGSAFQSAVEKALYFFSYTILKKATVSITSSSSPSKQPHKLGTLSSLLLGYLSEWSHLPITLPLDCWTTAIQTSSSSPSGMKKDAFSILLQLLSDKGLKGMYKGIQAYQVLSLKPALQYTVFEQLKRILLLFQQEHKQEKNKIKTSLTAIEAFVLGMVARAVATVCVFPYLRAKVLMQVSSSSSSSESSSFKSNTTITDNSTSTESSSSYNATDTGTTSTPSTTSTPATTTIPEIVKQLYQTGGISELYRGVGPELTRGVLSAALMLMIKEQIATAVNNTMTIKTKKQQKPTQRQ